MDASTSTGASVFSSTNDQDQFSTSDTDALTTVVTTITNVAVNTTTTGRFNWIIQTVTVPENVTPPTIAVGSDYFYYYVWWFCSFLAILFLISICLCMLVAKLAQQRRLAMARKAAALSARQNVTINGYDADNSNAPVKMTEINNNATTEGVTDLPPAYDDVIQIVNAKLDLQAAEEGAVGGMTSAISTSTMETNVEMDGSAVDISAVMRTPTMLPPYA